MRSGVRNPLAGAFSVEAGFDVLLTDRPNPGISECSVQLKSYIILVRLDKPCKIIEPNLEPSAATFTAEPSPHLPHPPFLTLSEMVIPLLLRAACSNV